jgi:hypothetical protein
MLFSRQTGFPSMVIAFSVGTRDIMEILGRTDLTTERITART